MNLIPRHVAISPGSYAWRARTAISAILLMSALAVCTLASYSSRVKQDIWVPGGILMNEERFIGLRATLPLRGTVGYLGDPGGTRENAQAYYLTQYFLAPIVVAPDTAHDLVVANFASHSAMAAFAASRGFTVENDYANGVALLRRRRP